mgnify:CR=1 FL=1
MYGLRPSQRLLLESPPMHKLLVILLLTLLPLQWASAAVDLLCQQEIQRADMKHHHAHADRNGHDAELEQPKQTEPSQGTAALEHHHVIHHADCHAVIGVVDALKLEPSRVYAPTALSLFPSFIPAGPERPKWLAAA